MTLQQLLYEEDDFSAWKKGKPDSRGDRYQRGPYAVTTRTEFVNSQNRALPRMPVVTYEKTKYEKLHCRSGPAVQRLTLVESNYIVEQLYYLYGILVPYTLFKNFHGEFSDRTGKLKVLLMFVKYYLGFYFLNRENWFSILMYYCLNAIWITAAWGAFTFTDSFLSWVFGALFTCVAIFVGHDKIKAIEKWETAFRV